MSVPIERTPRVKQVEGLFDLAPAKHSERRWHVALPIEERAWNIGLIVGPSGCGKSTLARECFGSASLPERAWPTDRAVIDAFPPGMGIKQIVALLSCVGFSSPPAWLRPYHALSTGEQFRVQIARGLAESKELCVVDEFTSVVDRTVARIGSAAIARTVRAVGKKFVAVTCHYDVVAWLDPDWIYDPSVDEFAWRSLRGRPAIRLEICRVHRSAWRLFKHHHYLSGDLNPFAQCFVAFVEGQPAAFAAVISGPDSLGGHFREHRVVCLPDFQGVGIGNALSEFVASLYVARKRYFSRTSHPGMIRHRMKSPNWSCIAGPGLKSRHSQSTLAKTGSARRLAASFQFVGAPCMDEVIATLASRQRELAGASILRSRARSKRSFSLTARKHQVDQAQTQKSDEAPSGLRPTLAGVFQSSQPPFIAPGPTMNPRPDPLKNFAAPGERGSYADTRLLARAVRERWPIPEDMRKPIVDRQIEIARHAPKNTESTAAARCVLSMDAQNAKAELLNPFPQISVSSEAHVFINESPAERGRRLSAIAERLRARRMAGPTPPGGAGPDSTGTPPAPQSEGAGPGEPA